MKKTILLVSIVMISLSSLSQTTNDYLEMSREMLKVEKKAAIAEIMNLTESESVAFWELYNEYQGKNYLIQNKRISIIKEFADNFENLSSTKADELLNASFNYQTEVLKLKKSYYKKFKKIIPIGEAAKFFQAEGKIDNLVDAELSLQIPLLETKTN